MKILRKANLFMLGAPKCGTTSVANVLSEHEKIYLTEPKETYYFEKDVDRGIKRESDYNKIIGKAGKECEYIMDASTGYLYSDVAVNHILDYNPEAKFIVILRNPYQMAESLYYHAKRGGYESAKSFEEAWDLQAERKKQCSQDSMTRLLMYGDRCSTGTQLETALKAVGKDALKVMFFDDLKDNPEQFYNELFDFLGLKGVPASPNKIMNVRRKSKYPIVTRLIRYIGRLKGRLGMVSSLGIASFLSEKINVPMEKEKLTIEQLGKMSRVFEEQISIIEKLTDRSLNHWRKKL